MYVRLAFAVAAHRSAERSRRSLEPEILLVDEVLAVGDAAFQKKCLGKMGEVSREERPVLILEYN
jgi:lipopolysaccharide transport system ATP-binding protein